MAKQVYWTKCRWTGRKILKPPLKLIGAKTKVRDMLYLFFPEHNFYVEPFMGTAGVLIGKPRNIGDLEVTTDLNEYAINFYHVLQNEPEEFWQAMQFSHNALLKHEKLFFEVMKRQVTDPELDSVMKAVYFYLITKHCMNGIWRLNKKGECNSSWCKTVKGRGILTREWFDTVLDRIKYVQFVFQDYAEDLLQSAMLAHNSGGFLSQFVFFDPPYHACKTTYNGIGWKDDDFYKFFEIANRLTGKWLLTINDDPFIRDLFKDYNMLEHNVFYSCSQTPAGRGAKPELLIANYDLNPNIIKLDGKEKTNSSKRRNASVN